MVSLPLELHERIVDSLSAHTNALGACSLVSRHWFPRARYHLFWTLDLSADWTPEPNGMTSLLSLLLNSHTPATFTPYISSIILTRRTWGMTPVNSILSVLQRVGVVPNRLEIDCPAYEPLKPFFCASLRSLSLTLHLDIHIDTLLAYISAFPLLESLRLAGSARYQAEETGQTSDLDFIFRLQTLAVSGSNIATPLFSRLAEALCLCEHESRHLEPSIRTITLQNITVWTSVFDFLSSSAARNVSQLLVSNCHIESTPFPIPLNSLQHLAVADTEPPQGIHTLLKLSSTFGLGHFLPTLLLSTVTIAFSRVPSPSSFVHAPWEELDAILSSKARFPQLRRFTIGMANDMNNFGKLRLSPLPQGLQDVLCGKGNGVLERCSERGVMDFAK
ncbi:Serine/threonine-protein phosphatase [Mycena indigotica]|uniref:Serine/threonine-protein phosphatase n=1 Tax=Mycena indigotica TaxID=2126181 RepID=A0A8H6SIB9_9AGAR|nr:Serine/threonine-protein phosphatase [Mycena indigotica]KAF7299483.1 Serine/threonine-protein phosphatase [Mycena indigotica]